MLEYNFVASTGGAFAVRERDEDDLKNDYGIC